MSSLWNDAVEWTDFGSNALFASKQEEGAPSKQDEQKARGRRREERPKEELPSLSKSPTPSLSRESRLRQKSLESRAQLKIDTKIPIASIRPKKSTDQFFPTDGAAAAVFSTMSGSAVEVEVDEERGDLSAVVSGRQHGDERVVPTVKDEQAEASRDTKMELNQIKVDSEQDNASVGSDSTKFSARDSILRLAPVNALGASDLEKQALGSDSDSLLEIAPSSSEDLSVYSEGDLARLPPELMMEASDGSQDGDAESQRRITSHIGASSKTSKNGCRLWYILLALLMLALALVVAVLGVLLFGPDKSSPSPASGTVPSPSPPTSPPPPASGTVSPPPAAAAPTTAASTSPTTEASASPTTAASTPPTTAASTPQPTLVSLQDFIVSVSLDEGAAFVDPSSPQSKALEWLGGNANLETYADWRKIQRYVLAMFYYSTNGNEWLEQDGWLTDEHECDWFTSDDDPTCDENGAIIRLALSSNNLAGQIPRDLAILSNSLQFLAFRDSFLEGTIPSEVGLLSKLSHLRLQGNMLSGTIPVELTQTSKLEGLFLSRNKFDGFLPTEIGLWTNLKYLHLDQNELIGSVPSEIGGMSKLVEAAMSENDFSGSIPTEISELVSLELLSLSSDSSSLTGTLPSEVGLLSSLRFLTLYSADIEGSLATEIGLLADLDVLIIGRTQLTGSIPSEIGGLTRLERLVLSNNSKLKGMIPTEVGLLTNLVQLNIGEQKLFGTIPSELSLLTALDSFDAFDNDLTGPFICPEFIESCAVSCENATKQKCRVLE